MEWPRVRWSPLRSDQPANRCDLSEVINLRICPRSNAPAWNVLVFDLEEVAAISRGSQTPGDDVRIFPDPCRGRLEWPRVRWSPLRSDQPANRCDLFEVINRRICPRSNAPAWNILVFDLGEVAAISRGSQTPGNWLGLESIRSGLRTGKGCCGISSSSTCEYFLAPFQFAMPEE